MKKIYIQLLFIVPVFFIYSYILISNYTHGDQYIYRALYDALASASFRDVPSVAESYVDASDFISFYILWLGAYLGVDKDIYISFANTLILALLFIIARKYSINYTMIVLLLCNYYIIVLMTGAERLKFAFIFLFLAEIFHRQKWKIFFLVLSVLAHLQSIILLTPLAFQRYGELIRNLMLGHLHKSRFIALLVIGFIGVILFYYNETAMTVKYYAYSEAGALEESLQILLFMSLGLVFIKNRVSFFIVLFPLLMGTLFIGGNRLNMIAFVVGVYMYWLEKKGNHPFLYIIMIYFALKSVPFVYNILKHGSGFY